MSFESELDRWLTTPPDEEEAVLEDEFGSEIYSGDTYYSVGGWILSTSSLDDCGKYLEGSESFRCACCDEEFTEDNYKGLYYIIDGIEMCKDCVEATEETAYKDEDYGDY